MLQCAWRSFLLYHDIEVGVSDVDMVMQHQVEWPEGVRPLPLFDDYLKRGYYPFGVEGQLTLRLSQIIVQTLESDIPQFANLNVSTARKLKRLLGIIAESVPFKPNFTKIASIISVSRNSLDDYFAYMESAGLIAKTEFEEYKHTDEVAFWPIEIKGDLVLPT